MIKIFVRWSSILFMWKQWSSMWDLLLKVWIVYRCLSWWSTCQYPANTTSCWSLLVSDNIPFGSWSDKYEQRVSYSHFLLLDLFVTNIMMYLSIPTSFRFLVVWSALFCDHLLTYLVYLRVDQPFFGWDETNPKYQKLHPMHMALEKSR